MRPASLRRARRILAKRTGTAGHDDGVQGAVEQVEDGSGRNGIDLLETVRALSMACASSMSANQRYSRSPGRMRNRQRITNPTSPAAML